MRWPLIRDGLAGLIAGMLFPAYQDASAATDADMLFLVSDGASATTGSNAEEWSLIGLTPTIVASANGGSGVTVALLDGLTDCRHPDLATRCENVRIRGGRYRFDDAHGTHTAGIIAGTKYGVGPGVKIVNYAVLDDRFYVATGIKLISA